MQAYNVPRVPMMEFDAYIDSNRQAWDASANHHRNNDEWQKLIKGFSEPGFSTFDKTMETILRELPIQQKSVVQIGCNNGRELLSAVSLGATYGVGIDQSQEFLHQAEELKRVAQLPCEFVCTNVYDLPEHLHNQFDVCFITIGVLNWMPDLPAFFKAIAPLVSSKGKLVIYETHPFLEMFVPEEPEPFKPSVSYFTDTPYKSEEAIVYDGSEPDSTPASYWFTHTLSNIMTSCIDAGFSISNFSEYKHSNREVDYDIYANQDIQIPLCFSLVADKH